MLMRLTGSLTPSDISDTELVPKQLFFSSSGRICVVIDVRPELSLHLTALQRNMASVIPGLGGVNHTKYIFFLSRECTLPLLTFVLDIARRVPLEGAVMRRRLLLASLMETS